MSRIQMVLGALKSNGRKALVPYLTAGDPHPDRTVALMRALVEGGADVIELGVPFSDPMADGPVIQLACERALAAGTTLKRVLEMVAEFRRRDAQTPVVLMGYLNPVETLGLETFATQAKSAGVDGVLLVDLAAEEATEVAPTLRSAGLDCIFLLAPTTTPERMTRIASEASGYLYYVSLKGVTGAAHLDAGEVAVKLGEVRRHTDLPLMVGFGVKDAATATAVGRIADGVIIGSALVATIAAESGRPETLPQKLIEQLRPIRQALDALSG